MVAMQRRFFALGGTALAGFVACNSISGNGDLHAGGDQTGTPSAEAGGAPDSPTGNVDPSERRDAAPDVIIEPPKACPSAGRICAPVAPPGWDGPLLVYDQATSAAPACPASMALSKVDAHFGTPSAPHTCTACTCGAPTGVTCSTTYRAFEDDGCSGVLGVAQTLSTVCKGFDEAESFSVLTNAASGGSCVKGGGVVQSSAVVWPTSLFGCGAPSLLSEGCPDGTVCAPEPSSPFRAKHCIAQKGEVECPATTTPFTKKLALGYEGVTDTRACATCNCAAPAGVTCSNTIQAYSESTSCNGGAQTFSVANTACHDNFEALSVRLLGAYTITGGACAGAGPSAPSGGVAPKDPVTVCCIPD
jgi:hypothetical protein